MHSTSLQTPETIQVSIHTLEMKEVPRILQWAHHIQERWPATVDGLDLRGVQTVDLHLETLPV